MSSIDIYVFVYDEHMIYKFHFLSCTLLCRFTWRLLVVHPGGAIRAASQGIRHGATFQYSADVSRQKNTNRSGSRFFPTVVMAEKMTLLWCNSCHDTTAWQLGWWVLPFKVRFETTMIDYEFGKISGPHDSSGLETTTLFISYWSYFFVVFWCFNLCVFINKIKPPIWRTNRIPRCRARTRLLLQSDASGVSSCRFFNWDDDFFCFRWLKTMKTRPCFSVMILLDKLMLGLFVQQQWAGLGNPVFLICPWTWQA